MKNAIERKNTINAILIVYLLNNMSIINIVGINITRRKENQDISNQLRSSFSKIFFISLNHFINISVCSLDVSFVTSFNFLFSFSNSF
jgi:hypothetical protein